MTETHQLTRTFRAMNTDVLAVLVIGPSEIDAASTALAEVEARFHNTEAALSRFRPDSELSRLNRAAGAGAPVPVSPLLFAVLSAALDAARETDGLFDPTVLSALISAGYDRSFELLPSDRAAEAEHRKPLRCSWRDVTLDADRRTVVLAPGVGIDLGGIAKGWTVDRAADLLRPFWSFAVDAGGDLVAGGRQADGSPWTIGVQDPYQPERDLLELRLNGRGVATSSSRRRRWQVGGAERHHLIDPRTGESAETNVAAASVLAPSVMRAEVLAKVALLLGADRGLAFLAEQPCVEGLLVCTDRTVQHTSTSARYPVA
jgi:thiamine biosynthesis lipoprotein